MTKQVYLAGPEVFFPDCDTHFGVLEALCASFGLRGRRPAEASLEQTAPAGTHAPTRGELAERIYRGNVALINECDAVLANLMPFRNALEPDSGTVFEVGMAIALGKPVVGHLPQRHRSYEDRVIDECGLGRVEGTARFCGRQNLRVEEFGLPLNLMLARSTPLFATPDEAVRHLAALLA